MKDTPETRDKIRKIIAKGANAEDLLKRLDPKFVELRELYRSNLVHSVRTKAGQDTISMDACRITALEDLYEGLYSEAKSGANAQKAATLLESEK